MSLKTTISDILNTPFQYVLPKIRTQFKLRNKRVRYAHEDIQSSSFIKERSFVWNSILSSNQLNPTGDEISILKAYSERHTNHYFNILGSDWLSWSYKSEAIGFLGQKIESDHNFDIDSDGNWLANVVNQANFEESNRIWSHIKEINSDYEPIIWVKDLKSGYNFGFKTHFSQISIPSHLKGVDIKIPWEFGRMNYLPGFTLFALESGEEELLNEVKCQILDFIMANPPRWGVQWSSAMDAAIRLFNLCVSFDLLQESEDKDDLFAQIVVSSIQEHIDFCWEFREHKDGLANNHYLANLLGLIMGTSCLPKHAKNADIGNIVIKDFLHEIDKQFLDDGGNFESSLPYHFFSTEIAVLGLSIISRDNAKTKSKDFRKAFVKISRAFELCEFSMNEEKIPQIGDNDSARMFYWYLEGGNASEPEPDLLNYRSTFFLIKGFFKPEEDLNLHSSFTSLFMQSDFDLPEMYESKARTVHVSDLPFKKETEYKNPSDTDLLESMEFKFFDKFGLYIFKGKNIYLSVCGTNRHVRQYWPHTHNDKLSLELWINNQAVVRDPGSFVYTADSAIRNEYRSAKAHAGIIFDSEQQNTWEEGSKGIFRTIPGSKVTYIKSSINSLALKAEYSGTVHIREVFIQKDRVRVIDSCNKEFKVNQFPDIVFSNGYGKLES